MTSPGAAERSPESTFAGNGMVATSQPDAAAVGLRILDEGGSAVDAALAMAAALTVVEPCSNGIGGDAFALPDARAPHAGERWASPDHAATLRTIADSYGDAFYTGELADLIAAAGDTHGGALTRDDLADHRSEWVTPICTTFRGHRVYEIPPSGQGIAVLEALNLLDGLQVEPIDDADAIHLAIEATKLALTDAHAYVADPSTNPVPTAALMDPAYAAARRLHIGDLASDPGPGVPPGSNTVYLAAADADGMMVSFIQSNYAGFGSHVVVPGTGISLQNRGSGFSLESGHPNELAGGKRPFHTIIPGSLTTADGTPIGPFGVMGGHMHRPRATFRCCSPRWWAGWGPKRRLTGRAGSGIAAAPCSWRTGP